MLKFYEECSRCQFAQFLDFDTVECRKGVVFNASQKKCTEFQEKDGNHSEESSLYERINANIKQTEQDAVKQHTQRQAGTEIIDFGKKAQSQQGSGLSASVDDYEGYDYRINTRREVRVYNNPELRQSDIIRTEPQGALISFKREIIRHGFNLYKIKNERGKVEYIEKVPEITVECEVCEVKSYPLDVLLIKHQDYDQHIETIVPEEVEIKKKYAKDIDSSIERTFGHTIVRTKAAYDKEGKRTTLSSISLASQDVNVKIGRLVPSTKFFITEPHEGKQPKKIKLEDGTEGVLLTQTESYKTLTPPLLQFVMGLTMVITIGILLYIIISVVEATGYIVIIGLVAIAVAYIVMFVVGAPLYFILKGIGKRL
ncbi:hypothetical protein BKI52_22990 [marine bacterium AO1-C]|nr:hypothetical protein BKI52_22990 [marine bacterium AO1-C]